jgi:hypothetical protein
MRYFDDIRALSGNTPILKLNNLEIKKEVNIFANLSI